MHTLPGRFALDAKNHRPHVARRRCGRRSENTENNWRQHRGLGPGFLESIYEEALAVEFALSGIQFVRQYPVPLFYRDHQIGEHRLDFLVERKIVVELKAVSRLEDIHFAIGRSYLKAISLEDGLLFNFATIPLTIKRFCRERANNASPDLLA